MDNGTKIRKLIADINDELNKRELYNFYGILNYIVIKNEAMYGYSEEDIIKQLELLLEALKYDNGY